MDGEWFVLVQLVFIPVSSLHLYKYSWHFSIDYYRNQTESNYILAQCEP